jgi:L-iditol 2-dehydrogenase
MAKTMEALRKIATGPGNVQLQEVPIPEIGAKDVLMKVYATGVCSSDLLIREDRHFYEAPVTIGHEFVGIAEKVGRDVKRIKEGERFVADIEVGHQKWLGVTVDGAFAPYMRVPEHIIYPISKNVSLESAVWTEIMVSMYHQQQERGQVRIGDDVVVIGADAWGTMAVQGAKLAGARNVFVIGRRGEEKGLSIAKAVGADYTLPMDSQPEKTVMDVTGGKGAEVVIMYRLEEGEAVRLAVECARKAYEGPGGKGVILFVALWGHEISVNLDQVSLGQIDIRGSWSWNGPETWQHAVDLVERGVFKLEEMITGRYEFNQWEQAFDSFQKKNEVKALLYPNGKTWTPD